MVFKETKLTVVDNSGARKVLCIKVLRGSVGYPGAILVGVIKKAITKKFRSARRLLKKGEIHKLLLVSVRKELFRKTGTYISGPANLVVLLHKGLEPLGTRIKMPLLKEVRKTSSKIAMMAPNLY